MSNPTDRRYSETHEWHKLDGQTVTIGITRFAVDELTDVTFVELPDVGSDLKAGEGLGEIESVKATGQIYSGVSGKVLEINTAATEDPAVINEDPFEAGWLVKVDISDQADYDKLLDVDAYDQKFPSS
jgi:glycine cleavage system H protein